MSWEKIQRALRFRLGELFPREASIRALVRDIDGTLEAFVMWDGSAVNCWSEILRQVRLRHLEFDLIDAALEYYPQDPTLQKAKADITALNLGAASTPANGSSPVTPVNKPIDGTKPIEVFISYSEEDEKFKKQLETHLAPLKRDGIIRPWHSQQIKLGEAREQAIANLIDSAQIILLLMSPNFLESDQLYDDEMMRAINRQVAGEAVRVIPITVRHIDPGDPEDEKKPFEKLQGLPRNGKPVDTWRSSDEIWANIAHEIRLVCKDLRSSK